MKYPRCQYWQQIYPYTRPLCNGKGHTFDEGCRGHRSSCPSYRAEIRIDGLKCNCKECKEV